MRQVKKDVIRKRTWNSWQWLLLYYGWRDPRTPAYVKLTAAGALLYVISPIDLIPDVIPFAGWVDDLLVAPLLLSLAVRLLPAEVRIRAAAKAAARKRQGRWVMIVIVLLLVALVAWIIWRQYGTGK